MSISPSSSFQLECPVTKRPTVVVKPTDSSTPKTSFRTSTPNASDILFEQPTLMSPPSVYRRQPRVAPLRLQMHCLEVSLSLPKLGNTILGDNTFLDPAGTANSNKPSASCETASSDATMSTSHTTTTPLTPSQSFKDDSHTAGPIRWVATCQSGALYEISRTHLETPQLPTTKTSANAAKSLNLSTNKSGGSTVSCGLTQVEDATDTGESDSDIQSFTELMPHNTRIHYGSSPKAPPMRVPPTPTDGNGSVVSKRSLVNPTTPFPVVCKVALYTPRHQPLQRIVCGTASVFSVPTPTRGAAPTSPTSPMSPTSSFGGGTDEEEDSNPLGIERVRREYQSKSPLRLEHLPQSPLMLSKKMLLVLDLDETLAHALRPQHEYPNNVVPWSSESHDARLVFVREGQAFDEEVSKIVFARYRPFLREFLGALACHFQIAIFTASRQLYADALLDVMDPSGRVFPKSHRYYRHHCTTVINRPTVEVSADGGIDPKSTSFRGKDLRIFGRPLNEVVLLDNTVSCGYLQPRNLLPIPTWTGDSSDSALLQLIPVLKAVAQERDVCGVLERHLGPNAETPLYTPSERANIAL